MSFRITSILLTFIFVSFPVLSGKERGFLTVIDQAGVTVQVPRDVRRIVTGYFPATAFVFHLGSSERLVAFDRRSRAFQISSEIFKKRNLMPSIGSRQGLNIESILKVSPDLVILFPTKLGREYAGKLRKLGIPSVVISPESEDGVDETLRLLARILGKEDVAGKLTRLRKKIFREVVVKLRNLKRKRKVYFAASGNFFSTCTSRMLQDTIIEKAGCVNVARDLPGSRVEVSLEQIISWNPDLVILSRGSKLSVENVINNKQLQLLESVRNRKVFKMPSNLEPLDFPSAAYVLGVMWLAKKAYPEEFRDVDLTDYFNEFYSVSFGKGFVALGGRIE